MKKFSTLLTGLSIYMVCSCGNGKNVPLKENSERYTLQIEISSLYINDSCVFRGEHVYSTKIYFLARYGYSRNPKYTNTVRRLPSMIINKDVIVEPSVMFTNFDNKPAFFKIDYTIWKRSKEFKNKHVFYAQSEDFLLSTEICDLKQILFYNSSYIQDHKIPVQIEGVHRLIIE